VVDVLDAAKPHLLAGIGLPIVVHFQAISFCKYVPRGYPHVTPRGQKAKYINNINA
jgi:hypothetical protein